MTCLKHLLPKDCQFLAGLLQIGCRLIKLLGDRTDLGKLLYCFPNRSSEVFRQAEQPCAPLFLRGGTLTFELLLKFGLFGEQRL